MSLSGEFWPIHLHPRDDELLSSWIFRLAKGHGLKLETFCNLAWGKKTQIWNRDIDRLADRLFLEVLQQKTGVSPERIWQTTLTSLQGILSEEVTPNGKSRFILPLGIYHRIRSKHGMQFCPDCLADGEPYYRRLWRLAFATVCTSHHRLLLDRCPQCSAAINFHRGEMGDREKIQSKPSCFCSFCDYDLRESPNMGIAEKPLEKLVFWQKKLEVSLISGWIEFPPRNRIYSHLFFDGLRILVSVICSNIKATPLRWYLAEQALWDRPVPFLCRMQDFEHENILNRAKTLFWVEHLLEDWPHRFINWCIGTQTYSSPFTKDGYRLPFWLNEVVQGHLHIVFSELPSGNKNNGDYFRAGMSIVQERRNNFSTKN